MSFRNNLVLAIICLFSFNVVEITLAKGRGGIGFSGYHSSGYRAYHSESYGGARFHSSGIHRSSSSGTFHSVSSEREDFKLKAYTEALKRFLSENHENNENKEKNLNRIKKKPQKFLIKNSNSNFFFERNKDLL